MGRARDLANILSSSGNVALDSELALSLITPTSIAATGGSGSISATGAVSFTSASAISLNNVFSATHDNYYILINSTPSGSLDLRWRGRTGGSDNSSSLYDSGASYIDPTGGGFNNLTGANLAYGYISDQGNATGTGTMMNVFSPFAARPTTVHSETQVNTEATSYLKKSYGTYNATTSFDGITIYTSTGTFTGTIRVYGYRN
jgi:hypothetical protein